MEKFVLEIPNFIPSDICESIIQRFENDDRKDEGFYEFIVNDRIITREKKNVELYSDLPGWEDIVKIFTDYTVKVYDEYSKYLKSTFIGYGDPMYPVYSQEINQKRILCSGFPIQRIGEGKMYDWHHDGNLSNPHFIQIIFYLNTLQENQGGCTEFIDGKKVRPEVGKVLVYPCSWTFPHKGGEILDGYKYICTTIVSIPNSHYQGCYPSN